MVRNAVRGTVTAVLAVVSVAVTGCSSAAPDDGGNGRKTASKPRSAAQSAVKGGSIGGSGSACALPVAFDLAASWKPEAVQLR